MRILGLNGDVLLNSVFVNNHFMAITDFKFILFPPVIVWIYGQFVTGVQASGVAKDETDTGGDSHDNTKIEALIVCGVLVAVAIALLIALIIVCKKYMNIGKNYQSKCTEKQALYRKDETQMDTIRESSQETHITRLECENGQAVTENDREVIATVHMQPGDHCLLNRRPQVNGGPAVIGGSHYSQPKECNGYDPYASYTSINTLEAEKNEINRPTNLYENVNNRKRPPSDLEILDDTAVIKMRLNSDVEHFTVGSDDYAIVNKTRKSRSSEGSSGPQSPRVASAYDNIDSVEIIDSNYNQSTENILPIPTRGYRQTDFYIKDWANKKDTAV